MMSDRIRLVLLSFLTLFVELALIRWAGANVLYLSYFTNFVLLGSFLGIGIGFLRARAPRDLFPWAPVALTAFVSFVLLFPVQIDRSGSELVFFGADGTSGLPTWVMLPVIFVMTATVLALISEGTARVFVTLDPLEAYRLDIVGALAGIAAFTALSFLRAPPVAWGVVAGVVIVAVLGSARRTVHVVAVGALALILLWQSLAPHLSWSPYYQIGVFQGHDPRSGEDFFAVEVNGIPHQAIAPMALRRELEPQYFIPHERAARDVRDVLIIGAGTGSDVAIALAHGARRVDAVEIDPRLQQLGEELHPERPYATDRVKVIIDDGRAYLERTRERYDMILFSLPDSLTLVSGQSALRLESYLFTQQAIASAREHLRPGGIFAMYNYYREPWLVDRLAGALDRVFVQPPCVDRKGRSGLAVMMASDEVSSIDCPQRLTRTGSVAPPATDDHPFVYLRTRAIPGFYLLAIGAIIAFSLIAVRRVAGKLSGVGRYTDLFFMGAAFLLLETKNIVQFALLFGTTWLVNSLVFAGVLISVLAAIEVVRRVPTFNRRVLYAALAVSLLVAFVVPQAAMLHLAIPVRFLAATLLAFTPIFFANLIFADRFRGTADSTTAFAVNLLGAMAGGLVEYMALMTGYRALLLVVAVFYGLAFLTSRRTAVVPA